MALTLRRSIQGAVPLIAALALVFVVTSARAAEAPVGLGTADSFAVLAGTTVTNTGATVLTGDLGVDPGSSVTGSPTVFGAIHVNDAVSAAAKNDLVTAFDDAAGRSTTAAVAGDLVGQTLTSGVYTSTSSLQLTGTVTLDAQGDPQAVFVFQVASTLVTASASRVALIGGAQACNVFWQVGSSATLGTASQFKGNVLALTSIAAQTTATVEGRLLARNGAVTLDTNTVTRPACTTPSAMPPSTAAPTDSAVPVPTVSATTPLPTPSVLPTGVTSPTVGAELPTTGPRTPVDALLVVGAAGLLLGLLLVAGVRTRTAR